MTNITFRFSCFNLSSISNNVWLKFFFILTRKVTDFWHCTRPQTLHILAARQSVIKFQSSIRTKHDRVLTFSLSAKVTALWQNVRPGKMKEFMINWGLPSNPDKPNTSQCEDLRWSRLQGVIWDLRPHPEFKPTTPSSRWDDHFETQFPFPSNRDRIFVQTSFIFRGDLLITQSDRWWRGEEDRKRTELKSAFAKL